MTTYAQGAYRGVPFFIEYAGDIPWDILNPQKRINERGVFVAFGSNLDRASHINYGDAQEQLFEEAFRGVINKRIGQVKRKLKERLGEKAWKSEISYYHDAAGKIKNDIYDILNVKNMEEVKEFLDYAGVDYIAKDLTDPSQGDFCESLYFNSDGRKINKKDKKLYKGVVTEINNWVWGTCYRAIVPLNNGSSFMDEAQPAINKKSALTDYIKENIDCLLKKNSGKYTVRADYATGVSKNGDAIVVYARKKRLNIYADNLDDAKEIAGMYEGQAVILENEIR